MVKRLNVLVSVYACEPDKGSEPGVGWNWVKQIARFHEVWAITRANNRQPLERAQEKEQMPHVHWIYFDLPFWARFWKKGQRGVHLYYYLWQIGVYFVAKRLQRDVGFDLVHHVTFGTYWMPSLLALLPVPFVWGPLGGGESTPEAFYTTFSLRSKAYEWVRDAARWLGERDLFVHLDARRATIALAKARDSANRLQLLGANRVELYSEAGIASDEIVKLDTSPLRNANPFRLMSIGRLLHLKGFHLSLMAFAKFQQKLSNSEYCFIGDGPERQNLESLAKRTGVSDKVRFLGDLPRQEVLGKLTQADIFIHPSLHDSGGWVCLEAMAMGRPVICLDLGGQASQVTEETGIKVPAIFPEQVLNDLTMAMRRLAYDPTLRISMGKAGRKRIADHFDWDKKGTWMSEIYERVYRQCNQATHPYQNH